MAMDQPPGQSRVTDKILKRVTWPVLAGELPPLAESFEPRPETGSGLSGLPAGQTAVLTFPDQATSEPLAAMGGTGKTQLAVATARSLWRSGAVDLVSWVPASSRDAILTGYVQAFDAIGVHDPRDDAETVAVKFLAWLAETSRPWLVALDDLADPADLEGLWPRGAGRVLLTTRLPADSLGGPGRMIVPVGDFSPREAVSYLATRLSKESDQHTGVVDLVTALGGLPVALAQAASMIIDSGIGCAEYQWRFADRRRQMSSDSEHAAIISATWSLSLDHADNQPPAGLAELALALTALLDAGGIPEAVMTSRAACDYICAGQAAGSEGQSLVRGVLGNLHRVGLITVSADSAVHTVWMHTLVQAAIRRAIPPAMLEQAGPAAASALLQAWPRADSPPLLAQAMRACTAALQQSAGRLLWSPDMHPVLLRAGESLDNARLTRLAVGYWQTLADTGARILGPDHSRTLLASDQLAVSLEAAGRPENAIEVYEQELSERTRVLGWDHPDALAARSRLAQACLAGGRHDEAISLQESTLAGREQALGRDDPDTLASRADLAAAYRAAGRLDDAIIAFERALRAREKFLGAKHHDTLATRAELASTLQAAGRLDEAVRLEEQVLRERERRLGATHMETIAARASLAYAYRSAGRLKAALPLYKQVLADRERTLGRDHPDTLAARGNLASACHTAGKLKEAISLYEQTLEGHEKTHGADHRDTLAARGNLASAYHSAGRMVLAIPLYEQTLADYERAAGPDHAHTLTSRANLASAYHTVGRLTESIAIFEQTLADCERALPPDHALTRAIRENLEAARRA
jgi:tetratricopeptide (TPR) repeat protein